MQARRYDALDALRGLAMVWMTVFHFSYDLNHFGYIHQAFLTDPVWTWQRTAIVSLFLLCAGQGQAVALAQGQCWPRFWRRWAQVAGCALLVSAGSYAMFPQTFIYFGVLHGMAVMLIVARLAGPWLLRRPLRAVLLGALLVGLGVAAPHLAGTTPGSALFEGRWLNWLGWITHKPRTEDYVPLLPWLGVMLWGLAFGRWAVGRPWARAGLPGAVQPLAWLGRHSLSYYMLHQPVLIGAIMAVRWAKGIPLGS